MATKAKAKSKKTTAKPAAKKSAPKAVAKAAVVSKPAVAPKTTAKVSAKQANNPAVWGLIALLVVAAGATVYVLNKGTQDNTNIVETALVKQPKRTIPELIAATGGLSTTQKLLEASGLSEAWKKETTPFTLFVPTNEVWNTLLAKEGMTVDDLLKPENKEMLAAVFNGSRVGGTVKAENLTDGQAITYADGSTDTVSKKDGKIVLIDGNDSSKATLTRTNLEATNGFVHVIGEYTPAN